MERLTKARPAHQPVRFGLLFFCFLAFFFPSLAFLALANRSSVCSHTFYLPLFSLSFLCNSNSKGKQIKDGASMVGHGHANVDGPALATLSQFFTASCMTTGVAAAVVAGRSR